MATASLYGNNDYTPLQYRPYELPVNDIMKAFVAKNQFWEQGAARVKNVYESALNLDLTLDQNKEYKQNLLNNAQEEMKKLSSMDLSDVDVQKKGMSLFTPILKDRMIAIDDLLTKKKKSIFTEAEGYKTKKLSKDGKEGEGYSQNNLGYSLDGFEDFNSLTQRDEKTLNNLYNKLGNKSYIPAYDITQDYDNALKHCKGSSTEDSIPQKGTLYINVLSKKGASSDETAQCFEKGLTDKAKQQLEIEGWSLYKHNPSKLYEDYENNQLGALKTKVSSLKGSMDALQNSKEVQDVKLFKQYEKQYEEKSSDLKKASQEFKDMVGPNGVDYVMKNIKTIAGGLYKKRSIRELGEAYDNLDIINKMNPDTAAIAQAQMVNERTMQNIDFENDVYKLNLKHKNDLELAKQKGELFSNNSPGMSLPNANNTDLEKKGVQIKNAQDFFDKGNELRSNLHNSYNVIKDYLIDNNKGIDRNLINDNYIINYIDNHSNMKDNEVFNGFLNDYKKANKKWWIHDSVIKSADIQAQQELGPEYEDFKKKTIKLSDGTIISSNDILNLKKENNSIIGQPLYANNYTNDGNSITLNNKKLNNLNINDVKSINNILSENSSIIDKIKEKRIEILGNDKYDVGTTMNPRVTLSDDKPISIKLTEDIKRSLGITEKDPNKTSFQLNGHSRDGTSAIVSIIENGVPLTSEKDIDKFIVYGRNQNTDIRKVKIGGNWKVEIPKLLPKSDGIISDNGVDEAKALKYFQIENEYKLKKSGKSYTTSQNLSNGTYPITSPKGNEFRIITIYKNGKSYFKPEKLSDKKGWDTTGYPLYENGEDLIRDIEQDKI